MGKKLALLLGSTLITLGLLEVGVRLAGMAPGFASVELGRHVLSIDPELQWTNSSNAAGFNSLGLRGPELIEPKVAPRVLVVGDSLVAGHGLDDDETVPVLLSRRLSAAGRAIEALNGGVSGYNTIQEARWLELMAPRLQPDHVVLLYCLNDFVRSEGMPEGLVREAHAVGKAELLGEIQRLARASAFYRGLLEHCHLARFTHLALSPGGLPTLEKQDMQGGFATAAQDLGVVEQGLARIAWLARGQGFSVTVAIAPMFKQLDDSYRFADTHRAVGALAARFGFGVIDLLDVFRAHCAATGRTCAQPGDPVHFDAEGADLVAKALATQLVL